MCSGVSIWWRQVVSIIVATMVHEMCMVILHTCYWLTCTIGRAHDNQSKRHVVLCIVAMVVILSCEEPQSYCGLTFGDPGLLTYTDMKPS